MSPSSGRDETGSSARGQTEPLAALVAVFAIGVAVSTYALGAQHALPTAGDRDRDVAEPTLRRVADSLTADGVVDPSRLNQSLAAAPDGYALNVTVSVGNRTLTTGPTPPDGAERATRPVSVRLSPGWVRPGHLRVEVWT